MLLSINFILLHLYFRFGAGEIAATKKIAPEDFSQQTEKWEKIKCQCNAIFHYFPYGKYRITKSTHKNSLLLQFAIVVISANRREERSKLHGNCTQSESREFWLGVFCPSEHFVHKNRERAAHNINFTINFSVSLVIYNLQSL